ncbi:MAG: phage head spike fiber domain-containing protein, partial [bacterium]
MAISIKLDQVLSAIENTDGVGLQVLTADPTQVPEKGLIYSKDVDGYAELFFMDSEGNITQLSNQGSPVLSALDLDGYAAKVLLDSYALASDLDLYAEKTLLDSYALVGQGGGGGDLHPDGYLELPALSADATAADDYGTIYVKNTSVTNYVKQSEEFNVSPWSNTGILSYTTGQSDPFGGSDAFGLTATSGTGNKQLFQATLGAATSVDAVASFYVKAGQFNWILFQACGGGARAWFDLNTGMPGSHTGGSYQDHGLIYAG